MILRLIIAFTRWTWGISPAFITPNLENEKWCLAIGFGVVIDILALIGATGSFIMWLSERSKK